MKLSLIPLGCLYALLAAVSPVTLRAQSPVETATASLPEAPSPAEQNSSAQAATPPLDEKEKKKQQHDEAERQLKTEENQHLLGVVPSFSVVYGPTAPPLDAKQKFELALKGSFNPFEFVAVGAVAAIGQAQDSFPEYGQGWEGYGKRYGAGFLDAFDGNMIGNAALPVLLHQDPRYYRMGTGTIKKRIFYSIVSAVRCKGDNGKWQPSYSNILGNLAAGGISNLYYPASDRGVGLSFERGLTVTAEGAFGTLMQEFVPDLEKKFLHKKIPASVDATQP